MGGTISGLVVLDSIREQAEKLTQYVLTDKWILAQNLEYPRYKIQFPKHMKLKENED